MTFPTFMSDSKSFLPPPMSANVSILYIPHSPYLAAVIYEQPLIIMVDSPLKYSLIIVRKKVQVRLYTDMKIYFNCNQVN